MLVALRLILSLMKLDHQHLISLLLPFMPLYNGCSTAASLCLLFNAGFKSEA